MTNKQIVLISIHDVMPHNLNIINDILNKLKENYNIQYATLLVVPGLNWTNDQLKQLSQYTKNGHELAGHGWIHKAKNIKSLYHKCHSLLISRDVAEHLALSKKELFILLDNCYKWFASVNLPTPTLYVPPAWALGNFNKQDIKKCPFTSIETLTGIHYNEKTIKTPLLGYEADTLFRQIMVTLSNNINKFIAKLTKKPIRLSIHPNDFNLLLKEQLDKDLKKDARFLTYNNYLTIKN